MFEKLVMDNFQKHHHLEVDLDEHITVIVGPTDSGKSASIRALRWLCQNSPSGIDFLKEGQKEVSAKLYVDGHLIERSKTLSGKNTYSVDGKELKAFGQGVPDEVAQILNIEEINFQGQMDAPYWLSLSPGEVSRQLNSLIDLSIIDETTKNANRMVSRAKARLEVSQDHVKKKRQQLEDMDWLSDCQADANVVLAFESKLKHKKEDLEDLVKLHSELLDFTKQADGMRRKLSAVADVGKQAAVVRTKQQVLDGVAGVLNGVSALQSSLQFRTISTDEIDEAKARLVSASNQLQAIKKTIESARAAAQVAKNKKVLVDIGVVADAHDVYIDLKTKMDGIKSLVAAVEAKDLEAVGLMLRFDDTQKDIIKKTGGICPSCGGPLK